MRKIHTIVAVVTAVLATIVIIGITILIFSPHSLTDTAFEIIAFFVSIVSVTIAIISQVSAHQDRKNFTKIIHELKTIDSEVNDERAIDQDIREELDKLIAIDRDIYKQVSKKTKNTKKTQS